jgi:hypothetical protein
VSPAGLCNSNNYFPLTPGDLLFLTDGGMETVLIFKENMHLPHFAAFDLLKSEEGKDALRR